MSQWGRNGVASNTVKWAAQSLNEGSGKANISANNSALFNNVTADAFITGEAVGVFAASASEIANTDAEGSRVTTPGWQLRRAGAGPVVSIAVTVAGSGFVNGETITISGGQSNATGTIATTGTGNAMTSVTVTTGGRFINTTGLSYTFNRDYKHLKEVIVTDGGTGYDNTDTFVASNGTVNATGTVTTNTEGGITSLTIDTGAIGKWAAAKVNGDVPITVLAANGAASNGSTASLAANIVTSSSGTVVATLGGRAGRVHYETLVSVKSITSNTGNDTYLPQA